MQSAKAPASGVAGILARAGGKPVPKAVDEGKRAPGAPQTGSSGGSKTPEGKVVTSLGALLEARAKKTGVVTNDEWNASEHPLVENAPPPAPRVVTAGFAASMLKNMPKRRAE